MKLLSGLAHRFLLRCAPLTHSNTCYTSSLILGLGVSPMRRREFIALLGRGVVGWPRTARAQQVEKLPTIGILGGATAATWNTFLPAQRMSGWLSMRCSMPSRTISTGRLEHDKGQRSRAPR